jgi:membrane protein DedA with SNARE-associated domain
MISPPLEQIGHWIISVEQSMGVSGIVLLMGPESACIPLPSEVIMPFAGVLVAQGQISLWAAGVAGAFGCVVGSWAAYYVGLYGGRPFAEKYGRYLLMNPGDLETADKLFNRYGEAVTFFSRLLPVIRTFIAFPAGVARMNIWRFTLYTFAGSLPWCLGLAWVGRKMGEHWTELRPVFHRADAVIACALITLGALWVRHHFSFLKAAKARQETG